MSQLMPAYAYKWMTRVIPILSLIVAEGCGSGSTFKPVLIPVKGKVTYKGKPLTKGVVRFSADGYGRDAGGQLQPDGSYELTTFTHGDGVTPGTHRVFITEVDKSFAKDKVMKKYANPVASKLEVDVTPEKTEHNFDLP